jgi:hypothetical protein
VTWQIRDISGARVKIHDNDGSDERVIEIAGTSEQVSGSQKYLYHLEVGFGRYL